MTKTAKVIRTTRVSLDGFGHALDKCLALWAPARKQWRRTFANR